MAHRVDHNHPANERLDSGGDPDSRRFASYYKLEPLFDINCIGCCCNYLRDSRRYNISDGNAYQVKFGSATDWTDCCLKRKRKHGQFRTGNDINLGTPTKRTLQGGLTYQFYNNSARPSVIAVGEPIIARLESITIKKVNRDLVNGSKLNYHNAALLELYREKHVQESLYGTCERPRIPLIGQFERMAIEQ